jgi:pimeloyl-ACP methyl ester carboxylesterase
MADQSKPGDGYVLIHGAGLGAWLWERLVPELDRPALAVDLPGRDAKPADRRHLGLADYEQSVVDDVRAFDSERIVVVAHSISGVAVPGLVDALDARVASIVLVSAAVPAPGRRYLDVLTFGERIGLRMLWLLKPGGARVPLRAVRSQLANDLDDETVRSVAARLTPLPEARRVYTDCVHWERVPMMIPRLYVKLTDDHALKPRTQDAMAANANAEIVTLPGGHLPMLSRPEALARVLARPR